MIDSQENSPVTGVNPSLAIHTEDLRKTYREGLLNKRNIEALLGVSLQVHVGEVFGLLGPNGAGKTTLIKILLGIVRKSSGTASVLGFAAGSQASRARVGYLPENLHMAAHHTARTALRHFGALSRVNRDIVETRSNELLKLVGLDNRCDESVRRFSKGMGQRLGLAQALLHDPDLLILDEPTDGLDPVGRSQVREIIEELKRQGKTIFVNSHILQEVELICDRVAILASGRVRSSGTIDALRDDGKGTRTIIESVGIQADTIESMASSAAASVEQLPSGRIRIELLGDQQAEVDAMVDRIRESGGSICRLHQDRSTLEDVFLSLVEPSRVEAS